jgi:hypothetical protein
VSTAGLAYAPTTTISIHKRFWISIGKCQSKHMVDRLNPQPA